MRSVEILARYHAVGCRIDSLKCLDRVQVVSLRREGVNRRKDIDSIELLAGDVLVIQGKPDDLQAAEIELMAGL